MKASNIFPNASINVGVHTTSQMIEWINSSFTKIVVGCNSEEDLFDLQKQANEANIVNAIILDNGNTEFKEKCPGCNGKGFKDWYECEDNVGHDNRDLIIDDTQYFCHNCNGTGKINKPTYTCLAIGPDEAEKIDKITGELKLL